MNNSAIDRTPKANEVLLVAGSAFDMYFPRRKFMSPFREFKVGVISKERRRMNQIIRPQIVHLIGSARFLPLCNRQSRQSHSRQHPNNPEHRDPDNPPVRHYMYPRKSASEDIVPLPA